MRIDFFARPLAGLLAAMLCALALLGCGGGGASGVGSGGTGPSNTNGDLAAGPATVAVGPISGFGSIIVNGIKYDDSGATITTDDNGGLARADLRLGMTATVRGTSNATTGLGRASSVEISSELKGVVQARTATDFQLLGVNVRTTINTVFENASNVVDGDFVEVYGTFDAANRTLVASRVERKTIATQKLRGLVSNLDLNARRFNLGTTLIDFSNAGAVVGIANGSEVKVSGGTPPATGAWPVTSVRLQSPVSLTSVSRVEVKAVIEQFTSLANFRVAGLSVDGSAASVEGGLASALAAGVRVEVRGDVQAGVVRALRIKIEDSGGGSGSGSGGSGGSSSSGTAAEFEVKGTISSFVSPASFIVRGTRVNATGTVSFEGGTAAGLVNGACVEIKGVLQATASGSAVSATRIKFDDDCR